MRKRAATIEWHIAKDDQEWGQLYQPPTPTVQSRRRLPSGLGEALLLILLVAGVGSRQWYTTQTAWQRAKTELTAAVQQEVTTAPTVHVLELVGNHAIIHTTTAAFTTGQTRFYQRTAVGWQQMTPDAEAWGESQQLATTSFRWSYHEWDAPVVATVAPAIEVLYATLRHNFGLTNVPAAAKLAIEVSVNQQLDKLAPVWEAPDRLIVPAPALYQAPIDLTDADLLAQSLALPLLNDIMAQAGEQYRSDSRWQPLWQGLRLWQLWDLDLPLAAWREPIVQWLYAELPGSADQQAMLPQQYAKLCTVHTLWLPSPMQINIPLLCTALDKEPWYAATWGSHSPPTHLNQLDRSVLRVTTPDELPETDRQGSRGQSIALATLIEYAVATYGRERLPVLVASLSQYESWETLLPAVYGVPAADFETGWQNYLATHYGRSSR